MRSDTIYPYYLEKSSGWLKVPVAHLAALDLLNKISPLSRISYEGDAIYLHHDADCGLFQAVFFERFDRRHNQLTKESSVCSFVAHLTRYEPDFHRGPTALRFTEAEARRLADKRQDRIEARLLDIEHDHNDEPFI